MRAGWTNFLLVPSLKIISSWIILQLVVKLTGDSIVTKFPINPDQDPNLEPFSNASWEAYNISFFIKNSSAAASSSSSWMEIRRNLRFVFILLCSLAQSVKWSLRWLTLWLKLFRPPSYLCLVRAFYPVLLSCLSAGMSSVHCNVSSYRCGLAPSSGKRFLYS